VLENKKKDPDIINELERMLAYMDKSIATLRAATTKNQDKTKKNIMDRMAENKELITQLDDVREAKKELDKAQRKIILDNQTLKLQLTKKIND